MVVPFTKLSTQKPLILTSKIDLLFSGFSVNIGKQLRLPIFVAFECYSTVTAFARLRGWSTSVPLIKAI